MEEYERVYCYESLYQAHKLARRGKQNTREVILYEMRLSEHIERLSYHLKGHTYRIQGYRKFRIYDPKEREIQALCYGDRIVQHSLCDNVLGPYLEKHLIYDNSACRKGKGTHFALDRLTGFLREYNRKYRYREYTNIYRKTDTEVLNITSNELKKLAIKQLKDGVPVYIGLCIKKYRNIEKGILDTRIYNYEKDLGLKRLNKENAMKLDETHIQIL